MIALSKETLAVYLLDDDSSVLKATRRLLDSAGWNVEAFTSPIAFLEHAVTHRPGVAVIDILASNRGSDLLILNQKLR